MSTYAHPVALERVSKCVRCVRWCSERLSNVHTCTCTALTTPVKSACILCAKKKCKCTRAYAHMQRCIRFFVMKLVRTYSESCRSIVQAVVCRSLLLTVLLSRPNPSPDAVWELRLAHERNRTDYASALNTGPRWLYYDIPLVIETTVAQWLRRKPDRFDSGRVPVVIIIKAAPMGRGVFKRVFRPLFDISHD